MIRIRKPFSIRARHVRGALLLASVGATILGWPDRPSAGPAAPVSVLTQRNDNGRTGTNLQETALNVDNVSSGNFGLLFSLGPLDGLVYAQPLYVPNLSMG